MTCYTAIPVVIQRRGEKICTEKAGTNVRTEAKVMHPPPLKRLRRGVQPTAQTLRRSEKIKDSKKLVNDVSGSHLSLIYTFR